MPYLDRRIQAVTEEGTESDVFCCFQDKKRSGLLLCCKLYISESRNRGALDSIERAARLEPDAVIVKKFEDRAYNRVRYTLVSYVVHDSTGCPVYSPLQRAVVAMAEAAYGAVDLELHSGAHPRLGVVDDIVFHPLALASLDEAAWLAKSVATEIGNRFQGLSRQRLKVGWAEILVSVFESHLIQQLIINDSKRKKNPVINDHFTRLLHHPIAGP